MVALTASKVSAFRFPHRAQFERTVNALPTTLPAWNGEEGPRFRLEASPGAIRVTSTDFNKKQKREEAAKERHLRKNADMLLAELNAPKKHSTTIRQWSEKSRARMTLRLATLDYTPLFEAGHAPAMVTLTMPGEWESVAPTAHEFKRIVNKFRSSYLKHWGESCTGVWKLEFQHRGAPHLHIIMTPPEGTAYAPRSLDDLDHLAKCDGCPNEAHAQRYEFPRWVARMWAACVGHPDPAERRKHERAGTGVDYHELTKYADPKRIGIYFAKHGLYHEKEYQNVMPRIWRESGEGGARFWGYWVLRPLIASKETHEALIMHIMSERVRFPPPRAAHPLTAPSCTRNSRSSVPVDSVMRPFTTRYMANSATFTRRRVDAIPR